MKAPTADMRGSALGDFVGISWLLKDIEGVRVVGHGGTTNGQYSDFTMVPERNFAIISMTNSGPNGSQLNRELEKWAFDHYLGLVATPPEELPLDDDALRPYLGRFETIASVIEVRAADGPGRRRRGGRAAPGWPHGQPEELMLGSPYAAGL